MTTIISLCETCARFYDAEGIPRCEAFPGPEGIPEEILMMEFDHRDPYPGDGGKQYLPIQVELDVRETEAPSRQGTSERHVLTAYSATSRESIGRIIILLPERIIRFHGDAALLKKVWDRWSRIHDGDTRAVIDDLPDLLGTETFLSFDWETQDR